MSKQLTPHSIFVQQSPHTMRRLALHASALSDAEYHFFTKSLLEIADDDVEPTKGSAPGDVRFEEISIGIREARAWFRGRYSRVSLPIIDGVCIILL
jgi:hypothetical protein